MLCAKLLADTHFSQLVRYQDAHNTHLIHYQDAAIIYDLSKSESIA